MLSRNLLRNSSIVKWGYQDNFKSVYFIYLFIFFYEKISCVQKHSQANINQQNKKSLQKTTKATVFGAYKNSWEGGWFWCFLYAWNLFVKKKIINRIDSLISLYIFVRTYFYLWSFVKISSFYENLFEFFLFMIICANILF